MAVSRDAFQPLGFVLAVGAVAIALTVLLPKLLGAAGGAESEILSELQRSQRRGFSMKVEGSELALETSSARWARMTVSLADPRRAEVIATLDFEGRFGQTRISSLGVERIPFVLRDGEWLPEAGFAPTLARITATLERRRRALEAGNLEELALLAADRARVSSPEVKALTELQARRYTSRHWYIRSERDEVLVTESFRLEGTLPDRPVDERGDRRLSLQPRGQEFVFDSGLM